MCHCATTLIASAFWFMIQIATCKDRGQLPRLRLTSTVRLITPIIAAVPLRLSRGKSDMLLMSKPWIAKLIKRVQAFKPVVSVYFHRRTIIKAISCHYCSVFFALRLSSYQLRFFWFGFSTKIDLKEFLTSQNQIANKHFFGRRRGTELPDWGDTGWVNRHCRIIFLLPVTVTWGSAQFSIPAFWSPASI